MSKAIDNTSTDRADLHINRRTVLAGIAVIPMLFGSGLASAIADDASFSIGALLPLSGPGAEFGAQERSAIEAVIAKTNAAGGVRGRRINLVVRDTKGDPTEAARLANQLIFDEKVIALTTGRGSDTLAIADLAVRSKTPIFAMESTLSTTDPQAAYFKWVFRVCTTPTDDARLLGETLVKDGHKRLAVFFSEDAFGQQAADLIKRVASERKDFEIALATSAALRATDLTAPALAVRRSQADSVLVLSAAGATMAGTFIRKLRELGSKLPIYGSAALAQPATVRAAGDAAEGMVMAAVFNPHEAGPLQPLFEALAPHGGAQGFGSLLGAASAATIIEGLKAGATDGATLRDAMERLPPFTPFSAGTVQYTPEDHDGWGAKNLLLVTVRNGRFINRDK